jgi:hypothetical protein
MLNLARLATLLFISALSVGAATLPQTRDTCIGDFQFVDSCDDGNNDKCCGGKCFVDIVITEEGQPEPESIWVRSLPFSRTNTYSFVNTEMLHPDRLKRQEFRTLTTVLRASIAICCSLRLGIVIG